MSLQYSDFEPSQQNKESNRPKNRNQTLKNRKREKNMKVQHFLEAITNDDDNNGLHDFKGSSANVSSDYKDYSPSFNDNAKTREQESGNETSNEAYDDDVSREAFDNLQSTYANDYYKQFVPYYNQLANSQEVSGQKDMLLEKLNYMIHLLEEQQEEKTGHITEELILYTFLGVFVIFVVDSFARAGKYVR
jgi:hypothetical protein